MLILRYIFRYSDWLSAGRSGDWMPAGARFSPPIQTSPGAHPASCTMGTESFPWVKNGTGVTLTPHPFLVPWSWKSRAIPLLPLRAVRPIQRLSTCTVVRFTYFFKVYIATFQHYGPCLSSLEYMWFVPRSCGWMLSAGRESDSSVFQFFWRDLWVKSLNVRCPCSGSRVRRGRSLQRCVMLLWHTFGFFSFSLSPAHLNALSIRVHPGSGWVDVILSNQCLPRPTGWVSCADEVFIWALKHDFHVSSL
jgi:hypothetical protein